MIYRLLLGRNKKNAVIQTFGLLETQKPLGL